jgi:hypothetical protein
MKRLARLRHHRDCAGDDVGRDRFRNGGVEADG